MKKMPKSLKVVIIILAIVVVIALGIYRIYESIKPPITVEKAPVNVITSQVERGTIYATSPLTGRIDPIESAAIVPMIAGEVTRVAIKLGDYVNKGDLLFTLDKTQAQITYNQAKLAYDNAKEDYQRLGLLYDEGAVSLQQYQGAKAQYDAAEQSLKSATDALSYSTVTSPISGYVTSVNISEGSLASQASPAITIADVSKLEINASLSEYLINKAAVGDKVDIFIKTLSNEPYSGTITAISPAPALGTLTYPITISVDDDNGEIKAGMFAEVQIISDMKDDVICIPSDAVFIKSGETKVVVLDGSIPTITAVKTGLDNGTSVEIVEGLKEGDTIAISGQQYVIDGEAVSISR